ncbi:hypothetical protein F5X98DRAFT_351837 [Xylaria grammica]|nr:hypothetical protein F5X98DRAFT_351837 [Xylaria grammica]
MAALLRTKLGETYVGKGARIVVPENGSGYTPTFAYVAYGWLHVFAHRELDLDNQIPKDCPENLRQEIMSFENAEKVRPWQRVEGSGRMGLYIVYTSDQHWCPKEILQGPVGGPVICEECNKICESPAARRKHLDRDHDIPIDPHELPEV